jgi:hypothetical protein
MRPTVKIELTPYNALTIVSFMREFVQREEDDPKLQALCGAINQFEDQVIKNITNEQIDDCHAENQVNQLLGKSPER